MTRSGDPTRRWRMERAYVAVAVGILAIASHAQEVRTVAAPPADRSAKLYVTNREPLAASPLVKLPIGTITPGGWLRGQLELMKGGMTGHLEEISPWCKFETSAWR